MTGIGVMMLIRQSERSAYVQLVAAAIGMIFFCIIIKLIEDPDKVNKLRLPAMDLCGRSFGRNNCIR